MSGKLDRKFKARQVRRCDSLAATMKGVGVFVALCAALACACGGKIVGEGDPTGISADADGGPARSADAGSKGPDLETCSNMPQLGRDVAPIKREGKMPAPVGGLIQPGTYVKTAAYAYGGDNFGVPESNPTTLYLTRSMFGYVLGRPGERDYVRDAVRYEHKGTQLEGPIVCSSRPGDVYPGHHGVIEYTSTKDTFTVLNGPGRDSGWMFVYERVAP